MLAPLAVLSVGAVLAGMVWYTPFFGDHAAMQRFFAIPGAHEEAGDHGAGAEGVPADNVPGEAALAEGAQPAEAETAAGDHAIVAETENAAGEHAIVAQPGEGGIYMAADNHVLEDAHGAPIWVRTAAFWAMLLGLGVAWLFYIRRTDLPAKLAQNQRPLYNFLYNKWYFDEVYDWAFVRPAKRLGRFLWTRGDGSVIDGGINGLALGIVPFFSRLAGRAQSGYLFHYAFAMVVGVVVLITWMTLGGGS